MIDFQESFNARNLSAEQIARKFVYTDSFDKLKNPKHSIIFGARGCGKTTLMKMLTLPALYNWNVEIAEDFRRKIGFYSIYIPTDITWELKNKSLINANFKENEIDALVNVAFNISVFIALFNTFNDIFKYELNLSEDDFYNDKIKNYNLFVIENLKLSSKTFPSIDSIIQELHKINTEINFLINKHKDDFEISIIRSEIPFIDIDFLSTSLLIINKFCSKEFFDIDKKWAFCFDELEFAPSIIKVELYQYLRSTDQRLLFKLSSSPLVSEDVKEVLNENIAPSSGNDFESIKVWESQNNSKFQKEIIEKVLQENGINKSIEDYFGSNYRYLDKNDKNDDNYIKEIKELASKDDSFEKFLINKSISIDDPISLKNNNTLLRKIKPVVYFRNYLIEEHKNGKTKTKTNKKYIELFSGYEVLTDITDGNPRWLIGLINSIIQQCGKEKAEPNKQYDEIIKVSKRFSNFINSIAISENKWNFDSIISKIGKDFYNSLVNTSFNEEPETTFKIDIEDKQLLKIIEMGLFQGAFVFAEDINDCESDLKNKRLKLSYLFHPLHKILLRKNRSKNLSKIINEPIKEKLSHPNLFENEN